MCPRRRRPEHHHRHPDPVAAVLVGYHGTAGLASGLVVRDGYIYVADWDGGLLVLQENR